METRVALVLSAGGLFGAWQAGAWRALAGRLRPDLVVGASVGSLNGYAIAGRASPDELIEFWLRPELAEFEHLPDTIHGLMKRYHLQMDYGVVLTDLLRLKPKLFSGREVTWRHLAASAAIPGLLPYYKIHGRRYGDGGLLNPLPVWAAAELGATHIIALHVLPDIPSLWLKPFVKGFRCVFGYRPPLPQGVELLTLDAGTLGSVRDAITWKRANIDRWIDLGYQAAKNISIPNCLER